MRHHIYRAVRPHSNSSSGSIGGRVHAQSPCRLRGRDIHMTRSGRTAASILPASSTSDSIRPVVSTFLCTGQPDTPLFRFAILQRRRPSHVYAGKWAVISGSVKVGVDASPLTAAMRELKEETGLSEADVDVLVQGQSYDLADQNLGLVWRIHPFLTRMKITEGIIDYDEDAEQIVQSAKARITLDEEHCAINFISKGEIGQYDVVDGLSHALESLVKQWRITKIPAGGSDI